MIVIQIMMVVAGAVQGFMLTRTWDVGVWLQKALEGRVVRAPDWKFRFCAILLAVAPALIWAAPVETTSPRLLLARFLAGTMGGLFLGVMTLRPISDDPVEASLLVHKKPSVAVFGRFAEEDAEMRDFLRCLKDRRAKKLWKKFQPIPVDLDEDTVVVAKYDLDPAHGLQAIFFYKDGSRLEVDGRDRIFSEDLLDPRRFESLLQTALSQWQAAPVEARTPQASR